jgi:predicted short-subunit dehydrogenase-like oxidoreductase (DUF2520 family)
MLRSRSTDWKTGVTIVGPGRVGQAVGKLLRQAGVRILYVAARNRVKAKRAVRFIGGGRPVGLGAPELADSPVVLLTTNDGALASVARELARLRANWRGKVVLHTSGSQPAALLAPLRRRGAAVGSLHPFQTVPSPAVGVRNLTGCYWGIEGDRAALRISASYAKALSGVAFRIRPSRKILYHAAAFLTCPTIIALMHQSLALLRMAGVPDRMVRPLLGQFVAETARNFQQIDSRRAITGPVSRGDWSVVRQHLQALARHAPGSLPTYRALLGGIARVAGRRLPRDLREAAR